MLEYLVHLNPSKRIPNVALASAGIPSDLPRSRLSASELREGWRLSRAPETLRDYGDRFVSDGSCAILIVPSVIVPTESNYLLNARHRDFEKIEILPIEEFRWESRLPVPQQ